MRNIIFTKAEDAASELRALGHQVDISCHPTSWGNSAYVTTSRSIDRRSYVKSGFRLSDHGVGDPRKGSDEVCTIIDSGDITVEYLVEIATISDEILYDLKATLDAKREKQAQEEAQREAIRYAAEKKKATQDAARATYEAGMVEARMAFIATNYPDFDTLTKTKQRPIIRTFNKKYREKNPE